jgi:hypothetical protein
MPYRLITGRGSNTTANADPRLQSSGNLGLNARRQITILMPARAADQLKE